MVFTRMAAVAAWIGLIGPLVSIGLAVYALSQPIEVAKAISAQYFIGANPARVIDQAAVIMVCALVLGVLSEVSRAIIVRLKSDRR